jgi:hypothetical protein
MACIWEVLGMEEFIMAELLTMGSEGTMEGEDIIEVLLLEAIEVGEDVVDDYLQYFLHHY